jgi:hypothetical protein
MCYNTLTHSTNEDIFNINRKGDAKSRTLSRISDTTDTRCQMVFGSPWYIDPGVGR